MPIYIDETGDTGLKFDKNSSTHFVVALVAAERSDAVRRAAQEVRQKLHWPEEREFKFSDCHDDAKILYLSTVRRSDFQVHALVFDKRHLRPDLMRRDFYGYLVGLALEDVIDVVRGAHLILDESFKGKSRKRTFRTQLRTTLSASGGSGPLKSLSYRGSHTDDMLQLADMVVGAIGRAHRHDRRKDDQYKRIIQAKIVFERHYP